MLTGPVSFARYGDRHKIAPQGLFGGRIGTTGRFVLNPGTADEKTMKSKGLDTLQANDLVSLQLPGAAGYGDPRERALDAIDRDLADGKISPDNAEADYTIVVDRQNLCVHRDRTAALRKRVAQVEFNLLRAPPGRA